jgi:hypothetical protein
MYPDGPLVVVTLKLLSQSWPVAVPRVTTANSPCRDPFPGMISAKPDFLLNSG